MEQARYPAYGQRFPARYRRTDPSGDDCGLPVGEGKGHPEGMLREEDQREHTKDTGSADAAVLYRAGVALEDARMRAGQHI